MSNLSVVKNYCNIALQLAIIPTSRSAQIIKIARATHVLKACRLYKSSGDGAFRTSLALRKSEDDMAKDSARSGTFLFTSESVGVGHPG